MRSGLRVLKGVAGLGTSRRTKRNQPLARNSSRRAGLRAVGGSAAVVGRPGLGGAGKHARPGRPEHRARRRARARSPLMRPPASSSSPRRRKRLRPARPPARSPCSWTISMATHSTPRRPRRSTSRRLPPRAAFYLGTSQTTTVTIPAGSSTANFTYQDTTAGTPTVTAAAAGLTSATQQETITALPASQLMFTTVAQTISAGSTTGTITVQMDDTYGNPVAAGQAGSWSRLAPLPPKVCSTAAPRR